MGILTDRIGNRTGKEIRKVIGVGDFHDSTVVMEQFFQLKIVIQEVTEVIPEILFTDFSFPATPNLLSTIVISISFSSDPNPRNLP